MYIRLCNPLITRSFFLFGARGTGKTKLLQALFADKNVLWIDLLGEKESYQFAKNPSELTDRLAQCARVPDWVVIDEVQRAPRLLNDVHQLIESSQQKFALTGSSARKLKRGAANLLAGRALLNHLYPLTAEELGNDFSLEDAMNWGTLPGVITEPEILTRSEILKSYIDVYLREEIKEEQIVRQLDPFSRFLEAAAQSNGSIINLSRIGREAGTDAKSVSRYFQILEDTLLGFFLEPYHRSVRKRQRQQAKFYLFDLGVKRALEGSLRGVLVPSTYEWGKAFEQFIILEAIRLNSYYRADYRFSYLRTQSQLEVDLVAERKGDRTWVVEIKSSKFPDATEVNKLLNLAKSIPNARPAIFCTCEQRRLIQGVEILPWRDGLARMCKG